MSQMVRKQIYIRREQDERLKRKARELDVSEAELVRRGIETVLCTTSQEEIRKSAWERLRAGMEERANLKVPQTGRTWTRDEIYEERLERLSH